MKLHELSPAAGSVKAAWRKGELHSQKGNPVNRKLPRRSAERSPGAFARCDP